MLPPNAGEIWESLGFMVGLPFFLRRPFPAEQALSILRRRLDSRAAVFLDRMAGIFAGHPIHPYRRLLRAACCEAGDLKRLVDQEGVEGALTALYKNGVYLSVEEFKGRTPVVRGSFQMTVQPDMLRNNTRTRRFTVETSGSGGPRTPVPINLSYIRNRSVDAFLNLRARRGLSWAHGLWAVPGSSALVYLLEQAAFGKRPVRWFSQVHPGSSRLHPRYRWSTRAIRWASLPAGFPLPKLTHVPLDNPRPIIEWMRERISRGETPHLFTYTSSGIRLSLAAQQAGISLSGARLTVTGEPVTRLRLDSIQKCGARVLTRYGTAESGTIGYGCLCPSYPDEVHVLADRLALIQGKTSLYGEEKTGGLFVTTLDPDAPFLLLNVSLGDRATVAEGNCECPLDRLGWRTRIHSITSSEKLTSEGMMFLRSDVSRVVDEILPERFGGSPTQYQLLEEEDDLGRPRLRLLIHPHVGPVDSRAAAAALLEALGPGNGVDRLMGLLWRDARLIRVERRAPVPTASGKILPLLTIAYRNSIPRNDLGSRETNALS